MSSPSPLPSFHRELTALDVAGLLVGATIGADVYVIAGLGSALLGPAQLVAWAVGGGLAGLVALCFAQSGMLCPQVGGAYAYTRQAFGPAVGFMVGWMLYLAQWTALAVFPVAFTRYLGYLLPDQGSRAVILAGILLVGWITATNIVGVRWAGTTNNLLALGKLVPLLVFASIGLAALLTRPAETAVNLAPFAPLGWAGFPATFVLVYFAYTGVELVGLPAEEVRDAHHALPVGILAGTAVVTVLYLLVNLAAVGARPWWVLADSQAPLAVAAEALCGTLGLVPGVAGTAMAAGALLSIAGAAEAVALGTARLSYALAQDGLFPAIFSRLHPRFGTPYVGLLVQNLSALALAVTLDLAVLIALSVLFAALVYLITTLATVRLLRTAGDGQTLFGARVLAPLAVVGSLALAVSVVMSLGLGNLALATGLLGLALPLMLARGHQGDRDGAS